MSSLSMLALNQNHMRYIPIVSGEHTTVKENVALKSKGQTEKCNISVHK